MSRVCHSVGCPPRACPLCATVSGGILAQVVVGTAGRVKDAIDRHCFDLSNIRLLVLDEADNMLLDTKAGGGGLAAMAMQIKKCASRVLGNSGGRGSVMRGRVCPRVICLHRGKKHSAQLVQKEVRWKEQQRFGWHWREVGLFFCWEVGHSEHQGAVFSSIPIVFGT